MSRTIAHLPYDVKLLGGYTKTIECHDHRNGNCQIQTLEDWRQRFGPAQRGRGTSWLWSIPCSLELPYYALPRHFVRNMPRDHRRLGYEKPARGRARQQLTTARRDYNHYGHTDIEVEPYHHHHRALWDWF